MSEDAGQGPGEAAETRRGIALDRESLGGLYIFLAALNSYQLAHAAGLPGTLASGVIEACQVELLARWRRRLASGVIEFPAVVRRGEIGATVQAFREIAAGLRVPEAEIEVEADAAVRAFIEAADAAGRLALRIAELASQSHGARTGT